uniref:Carboxylate--amine ligase n=1 Tax=Thermosporothrix sp. COM3 TaxID=2490863 RepID=A0A455SW66_9CHLR|nr:carboxylate--amine ligase [Thermosporothrix sp. COM3]
MSSIRYFEEPTLRNPIAIVAFSGWNDAAESATTVMNHLINLWAPTKIAEIENEDFFVYTETRPTLKYVERGRREVIWPTHRFLVHRDPERDRDIILFLGPEPQLKWKTFSKAFLEVCHHFHVSEIVFLGALLADIPHSINVPVTGSSEDAAIQQRLRSFDLPASDYEGPTGIVGVLHEACQQENIDAVSFWAAAPNYLDTAPNIKVAAALLTYLNRYLELDLNLSVVYAEAERFEQQVTEMVESDPEASEYVRQLEEQMDEDEEEDTISISFKPDFLEESSPLPQADLIIREIEELLRKEREKKPQKHYDDDEKDCE